MSLLDLINAAVASLPPAPETPSNRTLNTMASGASTQVPLLTGRPVHIPGPAFDPANPAVFGSYKTELVVFDDPDRGTIKVNYWGGPDPRPEPHDHPWEDSEGVSFRSHIVSGGYTEEVTHPDGRTEVRHFRAGDVNVMRADCFHTVFDVLPGTVTLMVCGPRRVRPEGDIQWGYLVDGQYVGPNHPRVKDSNFFDRFCLLNPHRRPQTGWAAGLPSSLA